MLTFVKYHVFASMVSLITSTPRSACSPSSAIAQTTMFAIARALATTALVSVATSDATLAEFFAFIRDPNARARHITRSIVLAERVLFIGTLEFDL